MHEQHPFQTLPSLEGLSDNAYLETSRTFATDWHNLLDGTPSMDGELAPLALELQDRAAALSAVPESERAPLLISQYRDASNDFLVGHGQKPLDTEPITEKALREANVTMGEVVPGIPIIYTNGRNEALFDSRGSNFACTVLDGIEGSIPFVVMHDTREQNPHLHEENRLHEGTHILFAMARRQGLAPESDIDDKDMRVAFLETQTEAVSFTVAGQGQFRHAGVIQLLRQANMGPTADMLLDIDHLYREVIQTVEPEALALGMMQARNFDDMRVHLERMLEIGKDLPPRHKPVQAVAAKQLGGWAMI